MTRLLGTLIFLCSTGWVSAQSWCAPGATWTYNADLITAGYQRLSYNRDTLIDGLPAHVIDRFTAYQYPQQDPPYWSQVYTAYSSTYFITRTNAEVVELRNNDAWDTLYWFGAEIGDHWYPPHINGADCEPMVVVDTGMTLMDGLPLHWIQIDLGPRIYERIGSDLDMMVYCPNWIIDGPTGMRCYSDQNINVNFTQYGCETMVGINDHAQPRFLLAPNPGNEELQVAITAGGHTITLLDALGRIVHQQRSNGERIIIDTSALPAGPYLVRIDGERYQRWLKK